MLLKFFCLSFIGLVVSQRFPDERCPQVNLRPPNHIPHETDCGLFYVCNQGYRVLMPWGFSIFRNISLKFIFSSKSSRRCPPGKKIEQFFVLMNLSIFSFSGTLYDRQINQCQLEERVNCNPFPTVPQQFPTVPNAK